MTIPVTNSTKVLRRRQDGVGSSSAACAENNSPNDDPSMNRSYVFDYQEDQRARAAESNYCLSTFDSPITKSPRRGTSTITHQTPLSSSLPDSARRKKRQLENRFGSSAPTLLSLTSSPGRRQQCSKSTTTRGGRRQQETVAGGHHSVPFMPPLCNTSTTTSSDQKKNSQKKTNINHNNFNSSEASIKIGDLENNRPPQRIPSKASSSTNLHASLNSYLGVKNNNDNNNTRTGKLKRSSSKASRGSATSFDTNGAPKRKVKMRNTDRLLQNHRGHQSMGGRLERQDSGRQLGVLQRQNSRGRSPSKKLQRSMSFSGSNHSTTTKNSTMSTGASSSHRPSFTRQGSKSSVTSAPTSTTLTRSRSMSADNRNTSRPPLTRGLSKQRSQSSDRSVLSSQKDGSSQSHHNQDANSMIVNAAQPPTVIQRGDKTVVLVHVTQEQARQMPTTPTVQKGRLNFVTTTTTKDGKTTTVPFMHKGSIYPSYFPRKIPPMEEKPPKSLVLIWVVVSAELAFDLATTIIAFLSLVEDDECCGESINLGPIPMTVTAPFFLLVLAELSFLFRAMILTMWPSLFTGDVTEEEQAIRDARGFWKKFCCCWLRWKAKMVLKILNFLVLLNPFFGCVIAWMLLYQSNKVESFVVLGLEGGSILLHFFSVYLEGSCKTWGQFLCHCIPLIPFVVSIALILFYLKQGGVCYLVDSELFLFTGCELCADGFPPINNQCLINGTNFTVGSDGRLFNFNEVKGFADVSGALTQRVDQGGFCGNLEEEGPDVSFCFFQYN